MLTPESSVAESATTKGFSCLLCRQRKVRCDQQQPCANCTKAGKDCSFVAPVRGKRKRTKPPREGLHAKLARYEELLKANGITLEPSYEDDEDDASSDSETESFSHQQAKANPAGYRDLTAQRSQKPFGLNDGDTTSIGRDGTTRYRDSGVAQNQDPYGLDNVEPILLSKGGATRYLDNDVWGRLGRERFRRPDLVDLDHHVDRPEPYRDIGLSLADEQNSLFLEMAPTIANLASLHPSESAILYYKAVFIDRIDPLMKILHLPTFWDLLDRVRQSPHNASKSAEALVFTFYLVTTSTFDDSDCMRLLGVDRASAFGQYRLAARQTMINAEFLSTSKFETLQAYAMFMMGVRSSYRYDNLYMLSGIAIRLARKMGLHRDGSTLKLPFYEAEMRRRLWWHLMQLDFRLADTLSTRASMDLCASDAASPSNLEDVDFGPNTVEAPPERKGITGIVICRLRSELVGFFRQFLPPGSTDVRWEALFNEDISLSQKDAFIAEIEDRLEQHYLRYCDPSEPLHSLVQIMIRSSIAKMKLFAHNPRHFAGRGSDKIPQSERDIVFANASKLLEYAALVPGNKNLEKYMWQISTTYLWNTMLYMLIEGMHRRSGPEVDRMWQLIGKLLASFPDLFDGTVGAVGNALRKWILEVWDDYVLAKRELRLPEPAVPDFISDMRQSLQSLSDRLPQAPVPATMEAAAALTTDAQMLNFYGDGMQQGFEAVPDDGGLNSYMNYDFPDILSFEMNPNEWSQWENLISGNVSFPDITVKPM